MWRFLFLLPFLSLNGEITALYLSWYADPTTTMAIQWHTPQEEYEDTIFLEGKAVSGTHAPLERLLVHKVMLENLTPNTEYTFRIGTDPKVYRFRTAPDNLDTPLRFIIGGDVYAKTKIFRRMSKTVMENHPHFAVLGGDLAYAIHTHPFTSPFRRWTSFLSDWKDHMIGADGHIIPFLIVPGNHDISSDNYEMFFTLFAFPQKQLYRAVDFGSYLSLFLLDTGHFQPIEGRQTLWLDKALAKRSAVPFRFAIYHEAAYPSHYPYQGVVPKKIRTHWVPLFEKYSLMAAFENHNHAFKKTYPIKAGQIDPSGVVYIGDGGWGATPRKTNDLWYLEKHTRKNSVFLVELTSSEASIQALDLLNNQLDIISFNQVNK
ncbi:MAG TPA: fibronectin type III domain-containing protein [Chlamydiales bacterium]|nr:fibronectin type III domain-containing protein [Chlamydiales bacterium]